MIKVDDKELKKLERDMRAFASKAVPFATQATLNSAAFGTQKDARQHVAAELINRNKFTQGSIRVTRARGLSIPAQEAEVGSIAPYMKTQEFGGTKSKTGKHGVAITTSFAAGEGENAQPRTRLARRPNQLKNLKLANNRLSGMNRRQRNRVAIRAAARTSRNVVFLHLGRTRGIFRVTGTPHKPQIKMLHDLSRPTVTINANPWLAPAKDKNVARLPLYWRDALRFQLRRRGLLA